MERFDTKTVHEVRGAVDKELKIRTTVEVFDQSAERSDGLTERLANAFLSGQNNVSS